MRKQELPILDISLQETNELIHKLMRRIGTKNVRTAIERVNADELTIMPALFRRFCRRRSIPIWDTSQNCNRKDFIFIPVIANKISSMESAFKHMENNNVEMTDRAEALMRQIGIFNETPYNDEYICKVFVLVPVSNVEYARDRDKKTTMEAYIAQRAQDCGWTLPDPEDAVYLRLALNSEEQRQCDAAHITVMHTPLVPHGGVRMTNGPVRFLIMHCEHSTCRSGNILGVNAVSSGFYGSTLAYVAWQP